MAELLHTSGNFNYYVDVSQTPMEDNILVCPFDNPEKHAENLANNRLKGSIKSVLNARLDKELYPLLDTTNIGIIPILDSRGLICLPHTSSMIDFWNEEEIMHVYYPELCELAKKITGADKVAVAAHALRVQGSLDGPRLADTKANSRDAAFIVHNDLSNCCKDQFLHMFDKGVQSIINEPVKTGGLGLDREKLEKGRISVLNFWRPMCTTPLRRNPLAVLDASTIGDDDVVLCRHPPKEGNETFLKHYRLPVPFINTLIRPNESHQWYYWPHMTRDEVLVFKNYDSKGLQPHNGVGMHTSFNDPNTSLSEPPRESIEARVICFWDQ